MKIVFWTVSHLPDLGGFQWSTFRLAKALKKLGHEALFLTATTQDSGYDDVIEAVRLQAPSIPEWTRKSGRWLLENIDRFDIIHTIDLFYRSIGEQFDFLICSGLPSVIKIPTMGCVPRLITSQLLKCQLGKVDAIIALSEGIRLELQTVGVEFDRIHPIPNGVPCDEFIPSPDKVNSKKVVGFAGSDILILYAGRLVSRKRVDILLEASKRLAGKAKLILMGSGFDMRDSTEREMLNLARSIPNVLVLGARENTLAYYQASDIHILLSEREGQPNSVLEGMACALPTIATNIQGISNLIDDGKEGILVEVGDVNGTVSALNKLIHNSELRSVMGQAGRERALRQFEISTIADQYEELYRNLIMKRKGEINEDCPDNTL